MRLRSILHPTDLAANAEPAFVHALSLAVAARCTLRIIHINSSGGSVDWGDFPGVRTTLRRWKLIADETDKQALAELGLGVEKIRLQAQQVESGLLHHVKHKQPDSIVLATHRKSGFDRWLHQEVARPLAFGAAVPTLFVPYGMSGFVSSRSGRPRIENVTIPIDADPPAQPAVDCATGLAELVGAKKLRWSLTHIGEPQDIESPPRPLERPGWTWTERVKHGEPVEQILETAQQDRADLIALSTRGRQGFLDAMRGSTTERLLAGTDCPLLAVPVAAA